MTPALYCTAIGNLQPKPTPTNQQKPATRGQALLVGLALWSPRCAEWKHMNNNNNKNVAKISHTMNRFISLCENVVAETLIKHIHTKACNVCNGTVLL